MYSSALFKASSNKKESFNTKDIITSIGFLTKIIAIAISTDSYSYFSRQG